MYELSMTEDEYKIQMAKQLLKEAIEYVKPHQESSDKDKSHAACSLQKQINEFLQNG